MEFLLVDLNGFLMGFLIGFAWAIYIAAGISAGTPWAFLWAFAGHSLSISWAFPSVSPMLSMRSRQLLMGIPMRFHYFSMKSQLLIGRIWEVSAWEFPGHLHSSFHSNLVNCWWEITMKICLLARIACQRKSHSRLESHIFHQRLIVLFISQSDTVQLSFYISNINSLLHLQSDTANSD